MTSMYHNGRATPGTKNKRHVHKDKQTNQQDRPSAKGKNETAQIHMHRYLCGAIVGSVICDFVVVGTFLSYQPRPLDI